MASRFRNELLRGVIIGIVDLIGCVKYSRSNWFEGPYGFVVANPRALPFIPMKGQLGLIKVSVQASGVTCEMRCS